MLKKLNNQLLLAHRGYCAIAPENTKLAFLAAYEFGFDGVELDVHLTKDNELVIIHDETTNRTALVNKEIKTSSLKDLKQDNHAKFFHIQVPDQQIMTLKEFLDQFLDKFKIINVEIKTDVYAYFNIEKYIYDLISKYPTAKTKIIFSSFNFDSLEKLYELDPTLQLGFLWWTQTQFKKVDKKRILSVCKYLHPWIDIYEKHQKEYQKFNLPFNLWTLKSKKNYEKYLKDNKVFAQISNYKY